MIIAGSQELNQNFSNCSFTCFYSNIAVSQNRVPTDLESQGLEMSVNVRKKSWNFI